MKHLTFANVVSTLALFAALSGVSYAAVAFPANSVGTRQLKRDAVTASKLAAGAVAHATSPPVRSPGPTSVPPPWARFRPPRSPIRPRPSCAS